MNAFKVRDRNTGLYMCGGLSSLKWSRDGKVWIRLSHLKSAMHQYSKEIPANWELVILGPIGSMNMDVIWNAELKEDDVIKASVKI